MRNSWDVTEINPIFPHRTNNKDNMEATVFNPIQMHLLKMFSYDKSLEGLEELKEVLYQYYSKRMNEKLDEIDEMDPNEYWG